MSNYTLDGKEVPAGGYEALVRAEIMRGKYRNSFYGPEPFIPASRS
jgi:hypothetical protein